MVVLGLLLFGVLQTQAMFRDSLSFGIVAGLTLRNDGGLFFTALMAATGLALVLGALSTRPPRERLLPMAGIAASGTLLLVAHFSIFVNGIILPNQGQVAVTASFLFHDTATLSIAVFSLALVTLLLVIGGLLATFSLLTPRLLRERVLHPVTFGDHRTRVHLLTLGLAATGGVYAIQFFRYALTADSDPAGFFTTNLILVYYVLALLVLAAVGLATWRAFTLSQGDLRLRWSRSFQRNHRLLRKTESWLWGAILVLNLIILAAEPLYRPTSGQTARVFIVDSRGAAMFFLIVPAIYLLQRLATNRLHAHVRERRVDARIHLDAVLASSLTILAAWLVVGSLLLASRAPPLVTLSVLTAITTIILLFFAVRLDPTEPYLVAPRSGSTPVLLFAASALAILTGIMFWGGGNSVVTLYARGSGGFITPEGQFFQPYAVLFRLLGSLFIALPPVLGLWLLTRTRGAVAQPGHLALIGIGIVVAMNLLFTIQPSDPFDAAIGQTDVRIGFYILQFATVFDRVVLTLLWGVATALVLYAMSRVLRLVLRARPGNERPTEHV
jgi:hypothetical protein